MSDSKNNSKIVLEDLLKLKRAERPSADFWPRFEEELRKKQLAALVQPMKPVWYEFFGRRIFFRVYAPLGAAAVVALSVGLQRQPVQTRGVVVPSGPSVASAPLVEVAAEPISLAKSPVVSGSGGGRATLASETASVVASDTQAFSRESDPAPAVSASNVQVAEQLVVLGTATVKAASQVLAQAAGLTDTEVSRGDSTSANMVEPLAQLNTPRDNRRARLLAYTVAYDPHAAGSQDSARSRDRIARRISDESIYDSISRLGVSGDRVSIKF